MGMSRATAADWADKICDMLIGRCYTDMGIQVQRSTYDTADKGEEERAKQKRDLVYTLWKEISDARQSAEHRKIKLLPWTEAAQMK
jgi:hypothetical protein